MSSFERLIDRMDSLTAHRMGKTIYINALPYVGVESHFLPEMGPISGDGISYVVFSAEYQPDKKDTLLIDKVEYAITRYQRFNGKWLIFIEEASDDEGD